MTNTTNENSLIIIGAGFAGLGAGIYGQMNGYRTEIFEMHDKPGGLCTSWKRKEDTFDGCIHWLVGSNPDSGFNDYWQEVGIAQGRTIINMDEYLRFEGSDGRILIFFSDIYKFEKHLLEFSPSDREPISEFISGIRMSMVFDFPSEKAALPVRLIKKIGPGFSFAINAS